MPEFDCPGLPALRLELGRATRRPGRQTSPALEALIRELYTEIRDYRISGHGWGKLASMIRKNTKISCSNITVQRIFEKVDSEWEQQTGVAALQTLPRKRREAVK